MVDRLLSFATVMYEGPVAQPDRAQGFYPWGCEFESRRGLGWGKTDGRGSGHTSLPLALMFGVRGRLTV